MPRRTIGIAIIGAVAIGGAAIFVLPATAQDAPSVTLRAGRTRMLFGHEVGLWGKIVPPAENETVELVDEAGSVRASATTDQAGHFGFRLRPRANITLAARWIAATSEPVRLRVRPLVKSRLTGVRLFGRALARGQVRPRHSGGSVTIDLVRNGRVVATRSARLSNGRWFRTRLYIERPGRYRTRVTLDDDDHLIGRDATTTREPSMPSLSSGSRGGDVRRLEKRLVSLGYHLAGSDGRFDYRTSDALIAFNKVQGRPRVGSVDETTWRALADPRIPRPRASRPRFHIEVDQSKQVLYMVEDGKVTRVVHVSTGANGYTHDGVYRVYRKLAGYSAGGLYYPSYFDGLRAFHGWSSVPTYPASHGCVRLPMWTAQWVFDHAPIGTEVRVYH